ncbi:unnamed protein product [Nezara viridula]|uniref:BPTI/Kunitz inhibitor domain-containing protein n=1 Tax=Nezara viridula TaxID=85310 RepID=A0A9P0GW62_NEZVI|nr:unnamed protein product [Nezara viridula]
MEKRQTVKMVPSPDWIVGVSGLELCLSNCTWVETYVRNLYPWDAGTDSGVTYLSPDNKTEPKDRIRRITAAFPSDPNSPFYSSSGELKPLARLYLTRQRLYEKSCSGSNTENPEEPVSSRNCSVDEWSDWSPCSVSCSEGVRVRHRRTYGSDCKFEDGEEREICVEKKECIFTSEEAKEICVLPKPSGPCRGTFEKYYFNTETASCTKFISSGCPDSLNQFDKLEDCEKSCASVKDSYVTLKVLDTGLGDPKDSVESIVFHLGSHHLPAIDTWDPTILNPDIKDCTSIPASVPLCQRHGVSGLGPGVLQNWPGLAQTGFFAAKAGVPDSAVPGFALSLFPSLSTREL